MWPDAPIYTAVYDEEGTEGRFSDRTVHSSFLQRLRPSARTFRALLPLYPAAIESFDLSDYDLVVSSSSAWAHAVLCDERTVHVSYCHNPFRYAWNDRDQTLAPGCATRSPAPSCAEPSGAGASGTGSPPSAPIATWPTRAPPRPGSAPISDARRRSCIPPVNTARFSPGPVGDHYVVVSELMPHKRIDDRGRRLQRAGPAADRDRRRPRRPPAAPGRPAEHPLQRPAVRRRRGRDPPGRPRPGGDRGGGVRDRRRREPGLRPSGDRPPRRRRPGDDRRRRHRLLVVGRSRGPRRGRARRSTTPPSTPGPASRNARRFDRQSFREGMFAEVEETIGRGVRVTGGGTASRCPPRAWCGARCATPSTDGADPPCPRRSTRPHSTPRAPTGRGPFLTGSLTRVG